MFEVGFGNGALAGLYMGKLRLTDHGRPLACP